MKNHFVPLTIAFFFFQVAVVFGQTVPSDKQASQETQNLYFSIQKLATQGVMFGHEDDLTMGYNWKNAKAADSSDIKNLVGDYPALVGWDIGKIELGQPKNYWGVQFDKMAKGIRRVYDEGGINTISWLTANPVHTDQDAKGPAVNTIKDLFNDPNAMQLYKSYLDNVATFFHSLKGPNGEEIPVIFRLFHEQTGGWYWWGRNRCTPDDYIKLYRFTVDYLRKVRNVHNLLYAYCTDQFKSESQYLEHYPGDNYVDIIGADIYDSPKNHPGDAFVEKATTMVSIMKGVSQEKGKPFAIMETGLQLMPDQSWWTDSLLPVIKNSGMAYVMLWVNSRNSNYFGTFVGEPSADNFRQFHSERSVLFLKNIKTANIYNK